MRGRRGLRRPRPIKGAPGRRGGGGGGPGGGGGGGRGAAGGGARRRFRGRRRSGVVAGCPWDGHDGWSGLTRGKEPPGRGTSHGAQHRGGCWISKTSPGAMRPQWVLRVRLLGAGSAGRSEISLA